LRIRQPRRRGLDLGFRGFGGAALAAPQVELPLGIEADIEQIDIA
jgi:hypothetical protein